MKNKKAMSLPMETVVVMLIILVVLIVILLFANGTFDPLLDSLTQTANNSATSLNQTISIQ